MIDTLSIYALKNKLYHLRDDFDLNTIQQIIEEKSFFKKYQKMDLIYIIYFSNFPRNPEYNKEEIRQRCNNIINKILTISIENYTEDEIQKIKLLYFLHYLTNTLLDFDVNIIKLFISEIESYIIENINEDDIAMRYVNEELRLALLTFYQYSGDLYQEYEEQIEYHLEKAQKWIKFRLDIATEMQKG